MEFNKRRLFVGGIRHFTTEKSMREHFSKYGNIQDLEIIKDRYTGCNKGFGFVTFSDSSSSDRALADDEHVIMGKEVEVKIAIPKGSKDRQADSVVSGLINPKRIFVGGLPWNVTLKEFKEHFESFGTIVDAEIPRDHGDVNKLRGFGYITFDSEEAVENVLSEASHKIGDNSVDVRRATYRRKVEARPRPTYNSCNRGLCSHGGRFANYPCCCSRHCNGGIVARTPYYVWWNGFWYYYTDISFEYRDNTSYNTCAYNDSSFNSHSIPNGNGRGDCQEPPPVRGLSVGEVRSCKGLNSNGALRINDKDKGCNHFNGVNDTDKGKSVNKNGYNGTSKNQEILNVQFSQYIKSALRIDEVELKENGFEDQNGTCKNDQGELRVGENGVEDQTGLCSKFETVRI